MGGLAAGLGSLSPIVQLDGGAVAPDLTLLLLLRLPHRRLRLLPWGVLDRLLVLLNLRQREAKEGPHRTDHTGRTTQERRRREKGQGEVGKGRWARGGGQGESIIIISGSTNGPRVRVRC